MNWTAPFWKRARYNDKLITIEELGNITGPQDEFWSTEYKAFETKFKEHDKNNVNRPLMWTVIDTNRYFMLITFFGQIGSCILE